MPQSLYSTHPSYITSTQKWLDNLAVTEISWKDNFGQKIETIAEGWGRKLKSKEFPELAAILSYTFGECDVSECGGGGLEAHPCLTTEINIVQSIRQYNYYEENTRNNVDICPWWIQNFSSCCIIILKIIERVVDKQNNIISANKE